MKSATVYYSPPPHTHFFKSSLPYVQYVVFMFLMFVEVYGPVNLHGDYYPYTGGFCQYFEASSQSLHTTIVINLPVTCWETMWIQIKQVDIFTHFAQLYYFTKELMIMVLVLITGFAEIHCRMRKADSNDCWPSYSFKAPAWKCATWKRNNYYNHFADRIEEEQPFEWCGNLSRTVKYFNVFPSILQKQIKLFPCCIAVLLQNKRPLSARRAHCLHWWTMFLFLLSLVS